MPDAKITVSAVSIAAGELKTDAGAAQLRVGKSRIVDADWAMIATACKGEAMLIAALKVVDGRKP